MERQYIYIIPFLTIISLMDNVRCAGSFYGSPLVLDAFCENRGQYISAFTLPVNIAHVEGLPDYIHNKLMQLNSTALNSCFYSFIFINLITYNAILRWGLTRYKPTPSARRPRTLSGRPTLDPYESFPDVKRTL